MQTFSKQQYAVTWLSREVTMSQDALLAALRLSAGSPGAALALFQGDNWQARETLCQALAYSVPSGDWYSLLAALNHEQVIAKRLMRHRAEHSLQVPL